MEDNFDYYFLPRIEDFEDSYDYEIHDVYNANDRDSPEEDGLTHQRIATIFILQFRRAVTIIYID